MQEKVQLTKKIVFMFGYVQHSFKVHGTTNVCKMVVGHIH
ncbi:Uncharacterised protein [Pediococcus pentosaceus]|nr:Uncharacterised protein [Pediococcus pentosaceus]